MRLERMKRFKTALPLTIATILFTLVFISPAQASSNDCLEIRSITKTVEGESLDLTPTVINNCPEGKIGDLKAGSNTTGYRLKEISLEPNQERIYQFRDFPVTRREIFEVSVVSSHTGDPLTQVREIDVEPEPTLENGDRNLLITFLLNNIAIIVGIVIITIIAIILITPFIYHRKGNKPFESEITLEDLK